MFQKPRAVSSTKGFTLIELLVVIAIIAPLAAILFPVFARARENARRSSCSNNLKQLGLGMLQYAQDYDEMLPAGNSASNGFWGEGWGGGIFPYIKSTQIYVCPNDTSNTTTVANPHKVSYAANINLHYTNCNGGPGAALANIPKVSRQVMLSEATGTITDLRNPVENRTCAGPGISGCWQNANNGSDAAVSFGTGITGGKPVGTAPYTANARHFEGANYLLVDGHVKYYLPGRVSPGWNNTSATGAQGAGNSGVCGTTLAEGSGGNQFTITFSGT